MKKIERLTDEQIARFPEFIERWTKIGLCAEPADRPRAEAGVRLAYQCAGLNPPETIVWCGSPLANGLTRALVMGLKEPEIKTMTSVGASVRDSVRDSVSASVRASVGTSVRDSVWASVMDSVRASVRASVMDSVADSVRASVRASVMDSVADSVADSVWASVRASVRDSVRDSVYGQHESGWLAFYAYFRDACGLSEQTHKIAGISAVAQSANWWLPHANICWISERHHVLNRDDRGRLHCEDGPALAYPDGFSIHSWHGVTVDRQVIEQPQSQTVEQINGEQNEEIKRVRIERFGWQRYLTNINAQVIDSRRNDVECTREALMQAGDMRVLVCHCPSTARVYALEVDRSCQTTEQAQNYLWSGSRAAENRRLNIIGRS